MDRYLHRAAVIQAKHSHKIFSVNVLLLVANQNIKGLRHGKRYKILHLTERPQGNIKFLHKNASGLYKNEFFVYNERYQRVRHK